MKNDVGEHRCAKAGGNTVIAGKYSVEEISSSSIVGARNFQRRKARHCPAQQWEDELGQLIKMVIDLEMLNLMNYHIVEEDGQNAHCF